jgi:hypothetical protein
VRWALLLLVACTAPASPPAFDTGISIRVSPPPPPPDHTRSNQILAAYGKEHALGVDRRVPTAEELAAAADTDPIESISSDQWREMTPPMRMLRAWEAGQHAAWSAVCLPKLEAWWQSAKVIDDEMAARLAQPTPTDFYAGMVVWHQHWAWLKQRMQSDVAFSSLPRSDIGAWHRLVAAQDVWAANWAEQIEHPIAEASIVWDGRLLDALDTEQARFCTSSQRKWPPASRESGTAMRPRFLPARESGRVERIDPTGTELRVTRRDRETVIETVPPCKRVRCTGIDCNMDERNGWRDICVEKRVQRVHDVAFVLHLDAPPVVPKVGDFVGFFLAPSGHAVLASAARTEQAAPYFELAIY